MKSVMEKQFLSGPSGQLEVVIEPAEAEPMQPVVFVMCHPHPLYQGTMDNKVVTTMTKMFTRLGVTSVRFNYRGVGESEGKYGKGEGELEDALTVIDWVGETYPDYAIWLGGFSFGGYIAYRAASERPVEQLLTLAPGMMSFSIDDLSEPQVPWVVVVSDSDEVVDPKPVLDWLITRTMPFHLLKLSGVSHFFHGYLVKLRNSLMPIYQDRLANRKALG